MRNKLIIISSVLATETAAIIYAAGGLPPIQTAPKQAITTVAPSGPPVTRIADEGISIDVETILSDGSVRLVISLPKGSVGNLYRTTYDISNMSESTLTYYLGSKSLPIAKLQ